jgi:methylenetetrahydrofolate reductase (NADPH)
MPMEVKSKFSQALRTQRPVITAEFLPSRGADGSAIRQFVASLPKAVVALVVAENHEDIRACALASAALLVRENIEPILPLVVRDRNRIALQSDVLGASALGVANMLCVSGDHQSLGVCPQAAGAFDVDPLQLLQGLKAMRDEGVLLGGERLASAPGLFLAAVAHPFLRPLPFNLLQTKKKVAAGAQVLFTQPLWDMTGFAEWMTAVRDAGLHEKTHIVASVRPLASAEQAEALQKGHASAGISDAIIARMRKASNPAQEGIAICAEIAAKAKDIQGVRGIHILSAGREDALAPILSQAGLARA